MLRFRKKALLCASAGILASFSCYRWSNAFVFLSASASSPPPDPTSSSGSSADHHRYSSISALRKEYGNKGLNEEEIPTDPLALFKIWFNEAASREAYPTEPNSMCLSTVDPDTLQPEARFVLLKGLGNEDKPGFVFFTNYDSAKGKQLQKNPKAALSFFWGAFERSVRITGKVEKLRPEENELYFSERIRGSQISAWASQQSEPIHDRKLMEIKHKEYEEKFKDLPQVPRPEHWGGFILIPDKIEFWKGRESRFHDRIVYTRKTDGKWEVQRLQP